MIVLAEVVLAVVVMVGLPWAFVALSFNRELGKFLDGYDWFFPIDGIVAYAVWHYVKLKTART